MTSDTFSSVYQVSLNFPQSFIEALGDRDTYWWLKRDHGVVFKRPVIHTGGLNVTMGLFSISHNPSLKPFLFWGLPSVSLFFSYAKISLAARQYLKQTEVEITKNVSIKMFTRFKLALTQGCGNTMHDLSDLVPFQSGQVENFYLRVLGQVQMY